VKLVLAAVLAFGVGAGATLFDEIVLPAGPHPGVLAATDVNHDSRPDLIVSNPEGRTVTILLNDGGGRFHPAPGSPFACGASAN
jgi:hypothetical protein